ncbi:hypothetical protein NB706_002097 [Xanthomonas sacchari]|nr:hypothetical protein [Xanthomonas sacchari]
MAQVAAQDDHHVGLLDLRQRQRERLGQRGIGEVAVVHAVIEVAAVQALGQARQQRALLVGGGRMREHAQRVAAVGLEDLARGGQPFGPRHLAPLPVDLAHRPQCAVLGVQALVRVAVAVGQPALVDRFVVARHGAQHFAAAHVQEQVGAHRVVVAQRLARHQFPGPRAELEHLVGQRADRAHVDHVAGQLGGQRLAVVGTDLQVLAAVHAAQLVGAGDVRGEAHAARALDAAGHLGGDQRPDVLVRHHALALVEAADRAAIAQRHVLQLALAALIADRAVQRMVDQQEFHDAALVLQRLVAAGLHLHAVHDRRGAGRRRLGRLLDVDQAHAAVGRDRQLLVVAEARDRNAGLVGGLDDHRALRHDQRLAVDLDGHMAFRHDRGGRAGIVGLRAHAAAASSFLPSTIE